VEPSLAAWGSTLVSAFQVGRFADGGAASIGFATSRDAGRTWRSGILPQVTCPVLAIHGVHDEYGSTVHPEMIGQLSRGPSRVEILTDTYHVPHRERPELIVSLASEFLASLAS
jgi:pimeloyl-ACP methyl ester carboxylesterase